MSPDLIIFDCDGVLVDSEPISNRILCRMLNEIGLAIDLEETVRVFVGRSMSSCVEIIEERLGRSVPADFIETYKARAYPAFREELRPIPGIEQVLAGLTTPVCVASSSSLEKIRLALGVTGLLPRFEGRMFSGKEVARGKPDPDLFLYAARQMGVSPGNCAVVEDTVVGVRAGVSAGMTVFGFEGTTTANELARAGAVTFTDMKELLPLLQ